MPQTSSLQRPCPPLRREANRDTAIKTPNNPRHFNHFQFSNRDKMRLFHPGRISGSACFRASLPPRFSPARISVSPCLRGQSLR